MINFSPYIYEKFVFVSLANARGKYRISIASVFGYSLKLAKAGE